MQNRAGVLFGAACYLLWALFPLYFKLLQRSGAIEIIAHRAVWSLLTCALLVVLVRRWYQVGALLRSPRSVGVLVGAGFLVAVNWTIYVYGVNSGRTLDAALGYFINPLMVTFLGVVVLGERLRRLQWAAFGVGAVAVVVLVVAYGEFPYIAVGVATSFALYGLVKKQVGGKVGVLSGMVVENTGIAVAGLVVMAVLAASGRATVDMTTGYGWLVALAGPITAGPLLLFAASAKRVSLTTIGMLQYITPVGQFLLGWLAFGEQMPASRWVGFGLVWVAVGLFVADAVRSARRPATVVSPR